MNNFPHPNLFTEEKKSKLWTIEENSKAIYFCLINTFIMDTFLGTKYFQR